MRHDAAPYTYFSPAGALPRLAVLRLSGNPLRDARERAAVESHGGCASAVRRLCEEQSGE